MVSELEKQWLEHHHLFLFCLIFASNILTPLLIFSIGVFISLTVIFARRTLPILIVSLGASCSLDEASIRFFWHPVWKKGPTALLIDSMAIVQSISFCSPKVFFFSSFSLIGMTMISPASFEVCLVLTGRLPTASLFVNTDGSFRLCSHLEWIAATTALSFCKFVLLLSRIPSWRACSTKSSDRSPIPLNYINWSHKWSWMACTFGASILRSISLHNLISSFTYKLSITLSSSSNKPDFFRAIEKILLKALSAFLNLWMTSMTSASTHLVSSGISKRARTTSSIILSQLVINTFIALPLYFPPW